LLPQSAFSSQIQSL